MKIKETYFKSTGEVRVPQLGEWFVDEVGNYILCTVNLLGFGELPEHEIYEKITTETDWKPTGGESFYRISLAIKEDRHDNTAQDFEYINMGNCFKTSKEANEMKEILERVIMKGFGK